MHVKLLLIFAASMLIVFSGLAQFSVFAVDESDAVAAIAEAEEEIVLCYDAVAEADEAGANVTALLATLDEAGELLSEAELFLSVGDFDSAVYFAGQSQAVLNGFVEEAEALTEEAVRERYWDLVVNVGGSVVGAVAVVGGGFAVWTLSKRRH